jgi:hypothetical protein
MAAARRATKGVRLFPQGGISRRFGDFEGGILQILAEGQTIRHEQYGIGTVTESNTDRTTIDFDNHGVKRFVTSIWTAELIGEPPADRAPRRRGRRKAAAKKA